MDQSPKVSPFADLGGLELTPYVQSALEADGITAPTEVQLAAIGPVLAGHSLVIESGTGTGKTLAYLLPILQKLRQSAGSRAVCFAPATELAVQSLRVAERYKEPTLKTVALVASGNLKLQASRLEKSTQLVVGTPGRILEMYEKRKLKGAGIVVLDEPEPILAGPGASYLCEVLSRPDPKLQLILVGATFGAKSKQFIERFLGDKVIRTQVTDTPLLSCISHLAVSVRNIAEKDFVLSRFISKHANQRAVVFVNQPNLIRHLYRTLTEQGIKTVTVSTERTKLQCEQGLREFTRDQAQVLLTTDRAATGLDIPGIQWVLHFELPNSAQAYVHRAGRTGRAGKTGSSVIFVGSADRPVMKHLEKELGIEFRGVG